MLRGEFHALMILWMTGLTFLRRSISVEAGPGEVDWDQVSVR